MSNIEKLRSVFSECLRVDAESIVDSLEYNTIPQWDSIAHMNLIGHIETAFDIMLETDDIINMSSFGKSIEILKKYEITF